jgi:hypothetical protein
MNVKLTDIAEKTYFQITNKFSDSKAKIFSDKTMSVIEMITLNNQIGSRSKKNSLSEIFNIKPVLFILQN